MTKVQNLMTKVFPRAKSPGKQCTFSWDEQVGFGGIRGISGVFCGFWWDEVGWLEFRTGEKEENGGEEHFTTELLRHGDEEREKSTFWRLSGPSGNPRMWLPKPATNQLPTIDVRFAKGGREKWWREHGLF